MNNFDDNNCTPSLYDVTSFPSVTSLNNFDIQTFAAQISAIEDAEPDVPITLYEPPFPSINQIQQAETDVFQTLGDSRFSGKDAYNFLHSRYKAIDITDTYGATPSSITLTACDSDGFPYTYTALNSAYVLDQNLYQIVLPIFDNYGQQVAFPLTDTEGKYVLTETLSAFDALKQTIHFPLKDSEGKIIKYPFKMKDGTTIAVPPTQNTEKILDVTKAYSALDFAYENAKDADAYKFIQYILNIEQNLKISFFYSTIKNQVQDISYFAACAYSKDATAEDLKSIISNKIQYFIRYYSDRADYAYNIYTDNGGSGPFTIISDTTSTSTADIIASENIKLASQTILSVPFWSKDKSDTSYYKNSVQISNVHTSLLEVHNIATTGTTNLSTLSAQVQTLNSLVNTLSSKLDNLITSFNSVSANVKFNSGVIDSLVIPSNWSNIWSITIPPTYVPPSNPGSRP